MINDYNICRLSLLSQSLSINADFVVAAICFDLITGYEQAASLLELVLKRLKQFIHFLPDNPCFTVADCLAVKHANGPGFMG